MLNKLKTKKDRPGNLMRESDLIYFVRRMNVRKVFKSNFNFKKIHYHKNEIILYNIAHCYQNQHKFAKAIEI